MKKRRVSVYQVAAALKQVEIWMPVADLIRGLCIAMLTFYRWKKQHD